MKLTKQIENINNSFRNLHERAVKFTEFLTKLGHNAEWGYYNSHSVYVNGEPYLEYYPIPVITVDDCCDVCMDFSRVSVEGKLYKEEAGNVETDCLRGYEFSICGTQDYLSDIYFKGMSDDELKNAVSESDEAEINLKIEIDGEPLIKEVLEIIKLFEELNTHIRSAEAETNVDKDSGAERLPPVLNAARALDDFDESTPAFEIAKALMEN